MSISSLLITARDTLLSNQMAIDITSSNVANMDTPGYTRQKAVMRSTGGVNAGSANTQLSVTVDGIDRIYDRYIESQLGEQRQNSGYSDTLLQGLNNIQLILDDSQGGGLNDQLNKFWSAWDTLSSNPDGIVERSTLVSTAQDLCGTIASYKSNLDSVSTDMNHSISDTVAQINDKIKDIAQLNAQIVGMAGSKGEKNALFDAQAQALKELRSMVNISSIDNADGSINVYLSNGDPLVQGMENHSLTVSLGANAQSEVYSDNPTHALAPINDCLISGKLGAYIELQGNTIPAYINDLNEVASTLATRVNTLHRDGFDTYKNTGLDFFTVNPAHPAATISVNAAIVADTNRIAASASVTQDGEMASRIAAIRDETNMSGNTATLNSFISEVVGQIGRQVASAKTDSEHQTTLLNNLSNQRDSISGVSIDEEMINLIQYQMGYNAAGRIVKTTNDMLDTLMGLLT
ncbi:MAG TPA: flagellar hook-associated protein FlgK [Syntrophales bacterium]|nr:flagellar hook-associated protein FlgK [Syntrophales bacterium]